VECNLLVEHSNVEGYMLNQGVAKQILEIVRAHPGCGLDELTSLLPDFSWSEIFVEVDRMSRSGQLRLTKNGSEFLARVHAI
jgi:hypothetical protein